MRNRQIAISIEVEQQIAAEDSVIILEEIIDKIVLKIKYRGKTGRDTNYVTLLKIIIYGYMEQITSVRGIEKACRRDINFKWLLQNQPPPGKSTIGRFIQENGEYIEEVFYEVVRYFSERKEIDYETVYVDGTKLEANANRYSFVWRKATEKHESRLDGKISVFIEEFNKEYHTEFTADAKAECLEYIVQIINQEAIEFVHGRGQHKTPIQRRYEELASYLERKAKYTGYNEKFKGRNSFSKTDVDATFMHMKEDHMRNSQLKPGYNMQIAVNSEYIVGLDVSNERSDQLTLIPLLKTLEEKLPDKFKSVTADAGYESEENYAYLEDNEQTAYIKPQNYKQSRKKSSKKWIGRRENMRYEADEDTYYCVQGEPLTFAYEKKRKSKSGFESHAKIYECANCDSCDRKKLCTKAKANKRLYVSVNFVKYRDKSLKNITNAQGILFRVNRSIQAEGAFGVLKEDYGFRRLNRRGHANVKNEFTLHCMAYNINKYCNKNKQNKCETHFYLPRAG
jgi:transposase